MKRRSFFRRIAQAAGILALAPQIAFRTPKPDFTLQFHKFELAACGTPRYTVYEFIMDRVQAEKYKAALVKYAHEKETAPQSSAPPLFKFPS